MNAPQIPTRLPSSTDFGGFKRGEVMLFAARCHGKSVTYLMGQPKLSFEEFRDRFKNLDGFLFPHLRAPGAIESRYATYERNHALANPVDLQPLPATVDPSQQKGNE